MSYIILNLEICKPTAWLVSRCGGRIRKVEKLPVKIVTAMLSSIPLISLVCVSGF